MSSPRLVLKQPTGWFAAGWEMAQALEILSDGAFKLYVWVCLHANRHSGGIGLDFAGLGRALQTSRIRIEADLEELCQRGVCQREGEALEVCDRFWPYEKQPAGGAGGVQAEFVRQVRDLFLARACVQSSFTPADEKLAHIFYERGVTLTQVGRAILLGCARKYVAMLNGQVAMTIASLRYFAPLVEEVRHSHVGEGYWEYLRRKVQEMEKMWLAGQTGGNEMREEK